MSAEFEAWKSAVSSVLVWPQRTTIYKVSASEPGEEGFFRGNYMIMYPSMPDVESERFTAVGTKDSRLDVSVDWKLVATTAEALVGTVSAPGGALGMLSKLIGRELTVAGRSCSPLEVYTTSPVAFDKEVGGLYYINGEARFTSRPA